MPAGIYLHIPFCKSRCSYCDFATDVYRNNDAVERYVAALCKEISGFTLPAPVRTASVRGRQDLQYKASSGNEVNSPAHASGSDIDTIYLGGGTPSLLTAKQVGKILNTINSKFDVSSDAEITMEMNPATVTPETLHDYRLLGVNRASFGVQTFNDHALKLLARGHDANDARQTFKMLRKAGFDNISFDLIAGLPAQTLDDWNTNLDKAITMQPEHLSLYLLEIHEGTPLAEQVRSGRQPTPDEDLAADMYELMLDKLAIAGYEQYEISNFSKPGFESRHNSKYWRLDPVFGFGVSAHSFDGKQRYANERDTAAYVNLVDTARSVEIMREEIDLSSEFAFLGLRLEEGIDLDEYHNRFGIQLQLEQEQRLSELHAAGLIRIMDNNLKLTRKGKLFSNEVFATFV